MVFEEIPVYIRASLWYFFCIYTEEIPKNDDNVHPIL